MNTLTYLLYLLLTWFITVHVGLIFYRNGRVFILNLFRHDEKLTNYVNRALLTGYYLINLGYAAMTLRTWETIETTEALFSSVLIKTGTIMLVLATIHFFNMAAIFLFSKRKNIFHQHKA